MKQNLAKFVNKLFETPNLLRIAVLAAFLCARWQVQLDHEGYQEHLEQVEHLQNAREPCFCTILTRQLHSIK